MRDSRSNFRNRRSAGRIRTWVTDSKQPEPWLRGTLKETPAVQRAVIHALQMTLEDVERWCGELSHEQLEARPGGVASVGFHLRHIPGSLDRLLTYAEGGEPSEFQMLVLRTEAGGDESAEELVARLREAVEQSMERIQSFSPQRLEEQRFVGRKRLPTTLGGLLVHIAEHTQRHVGQAIVTARIVKGSES